MQRRTSPRLADSARAAGGLFDRLPGAVLHEMRTSLTKGFAVHVLGYSLHYLLMKLVPTIRPGELDYCADRIVRVLFDDLYGEAAEKKEVDEIATSIKEARATKSYASFELLASVVSLRPVAHDAQLLTMLPALPVSCPAQVVAT